MHELELHLMGEDGPGSGWGACNLQSKETYHIMYILFPSKHPPFIMYPKMYVSQTPFAS